MGTLVNVEQLPRNFPWSLHPFSLALFRLKLRISAESGQHSIARPRVLKGIEA